MIELANKYKEKGVIWIAINSTAHATAEKSEEFAKKHQLSYMIIDDSSGEIGHAYGARTTPHMFILDKQGLVVYAGAIDNAPLGRVEQRQEIINYVDNALAELTEGKSVSTAETKAYGCTVKYAR